MKVVALIYLMLIFTSCQTIVIPRETREYVNSSVEKLSCYNEFARRVPDKEGVIELTLSASSNGSIESAEVIRNSIGDRVMENCVVSEVLKWKLPNTENIESEKLSIRIVFDQST